MAALKSLYLHFSHQKFNETLPNMFQLIYLSNIFIIKVIKYLINNSLIVFKLNTRGEMVSRHVCPECCHKGIPEGLPEGMPEGQHEGHTVPQLSLLFMIE